MATGRYEKQWTVHKADFPIPFPLRDDEVAALRAERILAGASARRPAGGRGPPGGGAGARDPAGAGTSCDSRTGCNGCHGNDFGGAAIIDIGVRRTLGRA